MLCLTHKISDRLFALSLRTLEMSPSIGISSYPSNASDVAAPL